MNTREQEDMRVDSSINEKTQKHASAPNLAAIMHASFGLDHYPNYLQRWSEPEIDELEKRLEEQLALVRKQKQQVAQRNQETAKFTPTNTVTKFDPELKNWDALEGIVDEKYLDCLKKSNGNPGPIEFGDIVDEVSPGVWSFPLLSAEFCKKLLADRNNFMDFVTNCTEEEQLRILGPSEKNEKLNERRLRFNLDTMGMKWLLDLLLSYVAVPLSSVVFNDELEGAKLNWRHGYIIGYADKGDSRGVIAKSGLIPHTDDSEVTLNIGLGNVFTGGELALWGVRGTPQEPHVQATHKFQVGQAVVHLGRQIHEVRDITSGERYQLIMWTRCFPLRSHVCPCCWMNRRHYKHADCVCGPGWN
eukprot:TRINITY_DN58082_c0_g1_i1.p1 TRINITY_DN58082_c0_g1~~TRINITY_DN58082_c0_g1_i1.p1  ORF type:complete len:360 (+),score=44.13 TRINITY_DN58082_c0_g1_i1:105-1184(+)